MGLTPELAAALNEDPARPIRDVWRMLRGDGLLGPLALLGAVTMAVGAVLLETLLFRGLFDIAWELNLSSQRFIAVASVILFVLVLLLFELPIEQESLRFGRHLELRLRMALLRKLPRLGDRYFQSRPISDMADRGHSLHLTRWAAGLGIGFVQAVFDLLVTLVGVALIDPDSAPLAVVISAVAIGLPLMAQPLINERDLRTRSHSGALHNFYLDALLGLVPARTHCAENAIRREHEALLVQWARASRSLVRWALLSEGVQSLACLSLSCLLLFQYFERSGVSGTVLLLVYWVLKLPAVGHRLSALAHQYPAQRNSLLRLMEPLAAPEETLSAGPGPHASSEPADSVPSDANGTCGSESAAVTARGVSIRIEGAQVLAGGHRILADVDLQVAAGDHVALVGPSGAGKSSLLGLLLGWHRLSDGRLLVDDRPLEGDALNRLRRETAWVDPAIQIWNRSLSDNLTYSSPDGSLERAGQALTAAELRGVLEKLPMGIQTPLGEGGTLVSGGEGQRVRLARALTQSGVRLALLDEPFRGLDREQRRDLLARARAWWADATLLCVTHDLTETLGFDRVLVIEGGCIVEDGAPQALAATDSRYRDLLEAEREVTDGLWRSEGWRRIRVQDGLVIDPGSNVRA